MILKRRYVYISGSEGYSLIRSYVVNKNNLNQKRDPEIGIESK